MASPGLSSAPVNARNRPLPGYTRQQPTATDIGKQADGDFREGQLGALADHAVAGAGHQADATAHHDAMAPAQDRLGIGVDEVIDAVFDVEELGGVAVPRMSPRPARGRRPCSCTGCAGRRRQERLFTGALQHNHGDASSSAQAFNCFSSRCAIGSEAVERTRRVERGNADARAAGHALFEQHTGASSAAVSVLMRSSTARRAFQEGRHALDLVGSVEQVDELRARPPAPRRGCRCGWPAPGSRAAMLVGLAACRASALASPHLLRRCARPRAF